MGTSASVAQLSAKLFLGGDAVNKAVHKGLLAGGLVVKKDALGQLAAAGAGSGRLSGVGRNGGRIGVRYTIQASTSGPVVRVGMTGQAHLLERDTKPHAIPAEVTATGRKRKRGRKALVLADGGVRSRVAKHPGTTGKHPWEKALNSALPKVPKAIDVATKAALAKVFH